MSAIAVLIAGVVSFRAVVSVSIIMRAKAPVSFADGAFVFSRDFAHLQLPALTNFGTMPMACMHSCEVCLPMQR